MTDQHGGETPQDAIGIDDSPLGGKLTLQEAVDEIEAMYRKAQRECFPADVQRNQRNAGRVRTLAQVLNLLGRADIEPSGGEEDE